MVQQQQEENYTREQGPALAELELVAEAANTRWDQKSIRIQMRNLAQCWMVKSSLMVAHPTESPVEKTGPATWNQWRRALAQVQH